MKYASCFFIDYHYCPIKIFKTFESPYK